jgi:hypothetical protein
MNAPATIIALMILVTQAAGGCDRHAPGTNAEREKESSKMNTPRESVLSGVKLNDVLAKYDGTLRLSEPSVGEFGLEYSARKDDSGGILRLRLAIFRTEIEAREAFDRQALFISVGPTPPAPSIGDACHVWRAGEATSGALLFRRENLVAFLSAGIELERRIAFGKLLDSLVVARDESTVWSSGATWPTVESIGLPERMKPGESATGRLRLAGVSAVEAMLGCANPDVMINHDVVRFVAPDEAGDVVLPVFVANRLNQFSRSRYTITVGAE